MKLEADLHIHTVASGHAFSTVQEIVEAAAKKGLKLVALTDHGPGMPGAAHEYHFWNLRVIPDEMEGVRVLKGIEANIVGPNGELDLPDEQLKLMDIVLVAFHSRCGYEGKTEEEHTRALLGAIRNPLVDIFAHPGNPNYPLNVAEVIEAALKHNVLLEINNSSFLTATSRSGAYAYDLAIAKAAYQKGLNVVINSDAHLASIVGEFGEAIKLAKEAGFGKDRVLNSSAERVLEFLRSRGKKV